MKFIRRPDLTMDIRINMALEGLSNLGVYGYITQMAETYKVSRTFIYYLLYDSLAALYVAINPQVYPKCLVNANSQVDKEILLQRLEGNSSIESISNILKYHNIYPSSVGYISQRLAYYGNKLSNTIEISSYEQVVIIPWLNDEIFANSQPIIVTVEPKSLAILRIELAEKRDSDTWKNHFNQLQQHGFYPQTLSSDRGKGIVTASKEMFPDVVFQSDTFHDTWDLCNVIDGHLQNKAYKAIAFEYKMEHAISSAKSTSEEAERRFSYNEAKEQANKAIDIYENASYLKAEICEQLEFIDKEGNFRHPESAKQNIAASIDLLKSLDDIKLFDAVCSFTNYLDELLSYMYDAQKIYKELADKIKNQELLQFLCLAWKYEHKLCQNPTSTQKKYLIDWRDFYLLYCQIVAGSDYNDFKEQVFSCLDDIIRGSSLIETVNSLIRPYLNTCKGQIKQEMLNLIMFYHNHRKFAHGKRKEKAPLEILMNQELKEHWVDILVDKVASLS